MTVFRQAAAFLQKHKIKDLSLCVLLLDDNADYPWFILVPKIPDITEITQLDISQAQQMWAEVDAVVRATQAIFKPDKLNIASIGNITAQLHIHVIARFRHDKAWPETVWNRNKESVYTEEDVRRIRNEMSSHILVNN